MEINHLTFSELIHYLDLYSTDPVVRRLVSILRNDTLREDLEAVGMDPSDNSFYDDYSYCGPREYIEHLRNEVDYYKKESQEWEDKCEEAQIERDRLSARSVASLLSSMEEQVRRAQAECHHADRIVDQVTQKNRELEEKINVWSILERT